MNSDKSSAQVVHTGPDGPAQLSRAEWALQHGIFIGDPPAASAMAHDVTTVLENAVAGTNDCVAESQTSSARVNGTGDFHCTSAVRLP